MSAAIWNRHITKQDTGQSFFIEPTRTIDTITHYIKQALLAHVININR
jgi:hypothetical protein